MKTQSTESIKPCNLLKEAANMVSVGIKLQEIKEYSKAKTSMLQGIERIKKVLIKDNSTDKEIVFEYVKKFLILI
jgi:translation initiation factor 2 alpha subunit (eIF-2alpha)